MSAPRNRLYSGYPGYQQPRFSQQEKLRGSDKVALWCGVAGWIMIILFLACGFVLYVASVNGEHSEYAGLSFIVPLHFRWKLPGNREPRGFSRGIHRYWVECDAASAVVVPTRNHPERGPVGHRRRRLCPDRCVGADKHLVVLSAADTATTERIVRNMSIPNQPVNPFSAHATQEVDLQQPGPVYQGYPQNDQSFHQGMTFQSKKPRSAASVFATFFVVIGFVIMLSPVLSAIFVGMIPGDHGDSGDALGWLPVLFLFWVAPWGLLMVIIGWHYRDN